VSHIGVVRQSGIRVALSFNDATAEVIADCFYVPLIGRCCIPCGHIVGVLSERPGRSGVSSCRTKPARYPSSAQAVGLRWLQLCLTSGFRAPSRTGGDTVT
jgi:hypothetical protein